MPDRPDVNTPDMGAPDITGPALVAASEIPYGVPLRIPAAAGSPFEVSLAAANQQARAAAIERTSRRFPGYDFEAAAQNVDDRRFAALEIGSCLVDELDGPATVERLLAGEHLWGLGGISFSHADLDGHQPPPAGVSWTAPAAIGDRGWISVGGLADALDDRWTAIINGANRFDPKLARVCADLSAVYGARINTNIYLSYAGAEGFGSHWDTHDTIIVPVLGRKLWSMYEPKLLSAQRPWVGSGVSERPLWSGELVPGGALVIPRGWGHSVSHRDDLSIHYTIGVARLEAHHVFERIAFEAGFSAPMRADFPFDLRGRIESYEGSIFDEPHGLAREAAALLTPELLERSQATFRARLGEQPFVPLVDAFRAAVIGRWDSVLVRVTAPGGVMLAEEDDDATVVAYGNRAFRLARATLDAFAMLAEGTPTALDSLAAVEVGGRDERAGFASQLVRCGAATVEPASSSA